MTDSTGSTGSTDLAELTELTAAARAVADDAARAHRAAFGGRFVAAYLLGSLAYGGYAPAVSDIDLAVVLADREDDDPGTVEALGAALRERGPRYGKLSVFWGSAPALARGEEDGRFPAIDRLELADRGVLLLGAEVAGQVARPAPGELLLETARFAVAVLATDAVLAEFHHPRRLLADPVWFTKAVMFPLRFGHSSATGSGRGARNDEAEAWYLSRPDAGAAPLVRLASRVRAGAPLDPAEAEPLLRNHLRELYRQYVTGALPRLREAGAPAGLVTAFVAWRDRLSSTVDDQR